MNDWIPCCSGTAHACGCGWSLAEIKNHCTCRDEVENKQLKQRIEDFNKALQVATGIVEMKIIR